MPAVILLYCIFKALYCKIKNVFFILCLSFLCTICVKSIINLLQYSTIQPIVLIGYLDCVGLVNKLDLNKCTLGMELICI